MNAGVVPTVPEPADPLPEQVLEKYRPALHLYVLRSLRQNRRDVADLTQEVFARFLRMQERGQVIRNPLGYMYKIASSIVSDMIEHAPPVTFDSQLAEDTVAQTSFGVTDDFSRRLGMRKDLIHALGRLPVAHRTILLLVEVDGMSCKEAARATGYAVQTCKQYLSVARQELLVTLEDYWNKEDREK